MGASFYLFFPLQRLGHISKGKHIDYFHNTHKNFFLYKMQGQTISINHVALKIQHL